MSAREGQVTQDKPICVGCCKHPREIPEYVEAVADDPDSFSDEDDYVRQEEGTYNHSNGHFLCTDCYIKAGMPSEPYPGRWTAP